MGLFDRLFDGLFENDKEEEEIAPEPDVSENREVTLYGENGEEFQFEFWDLITMGGHQYCVLLPLFNDDDSVCILEVIDEPDSDEESYISVDDETLNAVFAIFKERFEKRYGSE